MMGLARAGLLASRSFYLPRLTAEPGSQSGSCQQWRGWGFRRSLQRRNRPGFAPDSLFSSSRSQRHSSNMRETTTYSGLLERTAQFVGHFLKNGKVKFGKNLRKFVTLGRKLPPPWHAPKWAPQAKRFTPQLSNSPVHPGHHPPCRKNTACKIRKNGPYIAHLCFRLLHSTPAGPKASSEVSAVGATC